jgi:calcineurin-like phosphoesterase family protein
MIWFTGCTHFFDERVELLGRPFSSVEEMNETIIVNWNKKIAKADVVYHLGDVFRFTGGIKVKRQDYYEEIEKESIDQISLLNRLNGTKHLILGNYDPYNGKNIELLEYQKYFSTIQNQLRLDIDYKDLKFKLFLTHKPTDAVADRFNIISHIHRAFLLQKNMLNVGQDIHHFNPVSLDKVLFYYQGISSGYFDANVFCANHPANKDTARIL